jgi:hypothetical protein
MRALSSGKTRLRGDILLKFDQLNVYKLIDKNSCHGESTLYNSPPCPDEHIAHLDNFESPGEIESSLTDWIK